MSTLERIEKIESTLQSLNATIQNMSAQSAEWEQSAAAVAKTLAALSKVLVTNKVITGDDVLDRLRNQEEQQQKNQIEQLVAAGLLIVTDTVEENSVLAVSQTLVDKESGESVEVSGYVAVDLSNPQMTDKQRAKFVGLKDGGTFKGEGLPGEGKEEVITVLSIYRPQDVNVQGEEPATQAESPATSTGK